MSAIAHWIEQHGISTVVIGLVRLHLEKMLPPRSLWVPFELGRPVGAPADATQQQDVLLQALHMVESAEAGRIENYTDEDSRVAPDPNWKPPLTGRAHTPSVKRECEELKDAYDNFVATSGRTSVGVAGIPIEQCATLLDHVIEHGAVANSPRKEMSNVLMLRLAIDDLKAYYTEAALQGNSAHSKPGSRQLCDWFWLNTSAGQQIRQLRERLLSSDDRKLEGLARRFIIPHRWRISD